MPSNIEVLLSRLKGVRKQGKEWVALCPAHADSTPSLGVKISESGKVLIHCLADCAPADILAAVDMELADLFPERNLNGHVQPIAIPPEPERITCAPGRSAPTPILTHPTHGKPSMLHIYKTIDNQLLGYVMRFDTKEGKTFCPYTYSESGGWKHKAFSKPRPLYGLNRLREHPTGARILVEGEKAADALAALAPSNAVLSWCGGAGAAKYADLEPLAGQSIILWPDADEAGHKAVAELATRLHTLHCSIRVVDTTGLPDGFDAADLKEPLKPWITPRLRAYTPRPAPEPEQPAPEPVVEPVAVPAKPVATVTPITEARVRQQAKPVTDPDVLPAKYSHDAIAAAFTAANPDLRYVKTWGRWLYWSGAYWESDTTGKVEHLARETCRQQAEDAKTADASYSTVRSIVHANTISAVERLARADPAHSRSSEQWDADPWALNTPGGIVDLRDGSIRPGRPEDHATRITRATPTGNCPDWAQFLIDATNSNGELIAFLGRMAGSFLSGAVREHALFFVHGLGGNGKGTFLRTINWILNDYAWTADMDVFMEQKNPQHKTELASFFGRRLVSSEEITEGTRWNEARINKLTGGDTITANFMRCDQFTFHPTHKLLIVGNHKPIFRQVGDAIRRRLYLIPFTHKIDKPDLLLEERLRSQADGILRWMVQGCLEWQAKGLQAPEIVRLATDEYLSAQDLMATWIAECCEVGALWKTKTGNLYKSYQSWCESSGEAPLGRKRFTEAMESRGHPSMFYAGSYYISNIRVAPTEETTRSSRYQD